MDTKKFLIVDDDNDDNELFTEALNAIEPSIICYAATDGHEVFEKLGNRLIEDPDIIFLDINMPVMDGWQVLRKLKGDPGYSHIPVFIHSTSSRKSDRDMARELGAACFFTKMNDFRKLKKMLEIVVDKMNSNAVDAICSAVYKTLQ